VRLKIHLDFEISELNKVYTNGTLVDQELLTDEQAGHCISIREAAAEEEMPRPIIVLEFAS